MLSFLLLVFLMIHPNSGLHECSVQQIPEFGSTNDRDRPDRDRFQALIPAYKFQCSGKVTEWKACVEPGGKKDEQYYIQFQVWRPMQSSGCYSLVDYNIPLDNAMVEEREILESNRIIEAEGYLSPPGDDANPLHRCVVMPVRKSEQIDVQPGDIIGFYVDRFKKGTEDKEDGGVQWLENDSNVIVYYRENLPKINLKQYYAIGEQSPTTCGFGILELENDDSYSLDMQYPAHPIISFSMAVEESIINATTTLSTALVTSFLSDSASYNPFTNSKIVFSNASPTVSSGTVDEGSTNTDLFFLVLIIIFVPVIAVIVTVALAIARRRGDSYSCSLNKSTHSVQEGISVRSENNHSQVPPHTEQVHYDVPDPRNFLSSISTDYRVVYDDPTCPSYVNQVYSNGSVFESVGTWVPTMEARRRYDVLQPSHDGVTYENLHFFECDAVFWAPASTTDGLYEQLFTKHYREIDRNQICIVEQIGSGQFGTVCKGEWVYNSETMQVAVKTLRQNTGEGDRVKLLQEAAIMGQFIHPNIVRLYGVVTVGNPILVVLELMQNGDLKSYLDSLTIRDTDQTSFSSQFLKFGREIAAGMAYLSKKAFIHRDLAARNILLDVNLSCKVGDFGMARDIMDDTYYKSRGGMIPVKWTAPEALFYRKYTTASDVWSYAMVLYEIWSVGKKPFQDLNNTEVMHRLQSHQCLAAPSGCPRQVYLLMVDCWNPEPQRRPNFSGIYHFLQSPEDFLFHWSEKDAREGRNLFKVTLMTPSFSELQNKYLK